MRFPRPLWRSIDESPRRRAKLARKPAAAAVPLDRGTWLMEVSAIWLASLLAHALLGFFLVMFYLEVQTEPEQTYSVTVWRDAKGKDVLRMGAPEEGPPIRKDNSAGRLPASKIGVFKYPA